MATGPEPRSLAAELAPANPFATRYVRPGALEYEFPPGVDAPELVRRLASHGWRGEIVGPHGSGKSTLLAALLPAIRAAGREPVVVALHDGQRRLPLAARRLPANSPGLLVVDGYEQLGRWERWLARRRCRRAGWGLLATAHASVGLPTLFAAATSPELACRLAARLFSGAAISEPSAAPAEAEIRERFRRQRGNLRELWFDLYDLVESRRPGGSPPGAGLPKSRI